MRSPGVFIDDLGLGLNTKDRSSRLLPGQAQRADNVRLYPRGVRRALGFKRIVNALEGEPAVQIDGREQFFASRVGATGSSVDLTSSHTVEVIFRVDSLADRQTILFKGIGHELGTSDDMDDFDYELTLFQNSGTWTLRWSITNGSTIQTSDKTADEGGLAIVPGVFYHAAITYNGTFRRLYFHRVGNEIGTATSATSSSYVHKDTAPSWFTVGAQPTQDGVSQQERSQYHFRGVIQEIRFWNTARDAQDLEDDHQTQIDTSTSNLVNYWRLTETGPVKWESNPGSLDLYIYPRTGEWSGGLVGDGSMRMEGMLEGMTMRNAYLYLNQEPDFDGEIRPPAAFGFATTFRLSRLKDSQTMWHWTHIDGLSYVTNTIPAPAGANDLNSPAGTPVSNVGTTRALCQLEIVKNPANTNKHIRFVIWLNNRTSSTQEAWSICDTSTNIAVDTDYNVFAYYDHTNASLQLWVDGSAVTAIDTDNGSGDDRQFNASPNVDPIGSGYQYAMELGRAIGQSRKGITVPGDPNNADVTYDYDRSFEGELDQVVIVSNPSSPSFLANYLNDNELVRRNVNSLSSEMLTVLPFEEGAGNLVEDIGVHGNGPVIREDAEHVRARSGITTLSTKRITGLFDHRYRSPSGEVRQSVAIQGGSVYQFPSGLDHSPTSMSLLSDGFRNDDDNNVSAMKYLDGLILCSGTGRNFHLWKDQLWNLSIAPPEGHVDFGLKDLKTEAAKLEEGTYRYAFTFYSSYTGKRSPVGPQALVELLSESNVAFGDGNPVNQTYPETPSSANEAPFDMETAGTPAWIRFRSWIGRESTLLADDPPDWKTKPSDGSGSNPAKYWKAKFTKENGKKKPFIEDLESVEASEVKYLLEWKGKQKVQVIIGSDDSIRMRSVWPGANSFIEIDNKNSGGQNLVASGGLIDWGGSVPLLYQGTEDANGRPLPISRDPQVTHLEIWRTPANGVDFYRLARLPNGTTSYVDSTPDNLLAGELLEITTGSPPPVRYVFEFQGRAIYFGSKEFPQRLWWSEPGIPWSVPEQNSIDILDGDSMELTSGSQAEGLLIIFKQDATFILTQSPDPNIPFAIQMRSRDVGAESMFGSVSVNQEVFFPGEKGLYSFNGSNLYYLSEIIEPTWRSFDRANRNRIVAAHFREEESLLWFGPSGSTSVGGVVANDSGLIFHYAAGREGSRFFGWTRTTGLYVSIATVLPDANEQNTVYLVDPLGYVSVYGEGQAYGPDTTEITTEGILVQTSSTSTVLNLLQLNDATYPDGYRGFALTVYEGSNRETRYAISDDLGSPSAVTLDRALPWTPTTSATVIIGSIEADWRSGELEFGESTDVVKINRSHLDMESKTSGAAIEYGIQGVNGLRDGDLDEVIYSVLNTKRSEFIRDQSAGRGHLFRFRARGTDRDFEVIGFGVELEARDRGAGRSVSS